MINWTPEWNINWMKNTHNLYIFLLLQIEAVKLGSIFSGQMEKWTLEVLWPPGMAGLAKEHIGLASRDRTAYHSKGLVELVVNQH